MEVRVLGTMSREHFEPLLLHEMCLERCWKEGLVTGWKRYSEVKACCDLDRGIGFRLREIVDS